MLQSTFIVIGLFVALLAGQEIGRWLGRRHFRLRHENANTSAADTVVFAVLGLLIAFTLSSAASRFDDRRHLNVQQANALGTAWLRLDLLLPPDQPAIRQCMQKWVALVMETLPNKEAFTESELQDRLAEGQRIQNEVWQLAVAATKHHPTPQIGPFVLAPINDWIDLSTTRAQINNMPMPTLVVLTLSVLAILASILAGFSSHKPGERSLLHMLAFAAVIPFCIYVILDLNQPRSGLIRIDSSDAAMIQLQESFRSVAPAN